MELLLGVLAVLGGVALGLRLVGGLLGLGLVAAEASAAATLADASARRGDVTGMIERKEASADFRRRRRRAGGWVALWFGLLVVPVLAGVAGLVYPAAAVLWILPRQRLRRPQPQNGG